MALIAICWVIIPVYVGWSYLCMLGDHTSVCWVIIPVYAIGNHNGVATLESIRKPLLANWHTVQKHYFRCSYILCQLTALWYKQRRTTTEDHIMQLQLDTQFICTISHVRSHSYWYIIETIPQHHAVLGNHITMALVYVGGIFITTQLAS